jgi:4-amino-4-deoxy-L-arabinose transferase-like glycosyltransferase
MQAWREPRARFAIIAGLLLLVALVVRVIYVLHTQNYVARQDAHSYDYLAKQLARGKGWGYPNSAYRPPGFPAFLAGIYLVVGIPNGDYTAARIVEAVFAMVTAGLIGLMVWQLAGRVAALVALAIAALYIPLVLVGVALMSESLFVLLVLAATNCALRARAVALPATGHPYRWIVAAGVFSGLAALTRGNGIVLALALALIVWIARPRWAWRSLAAPLLLIAVSLLTIAPWTIRNASAQHAFIPVTDELGNTLKGTYNDLSAKQRFVWWGHGYSNYKSIQHDKRLTESERDSREISAVLSYIGKHPLYPVEATFWNTMRLLDLQGRRVSRMTAYADTFATAGVADAGVVNFWIVAVLAIAGAFCLAARRIPRSLWAVPLILWASSAPIVTGTPRHRAALDPFVILLAAIAVQAIVTALLRWREPARSERELDSAAIAA